MMDTTTTSAGRPNIDFPNEPPSFPPQHNTGKHHPWVWLIVLAVLAAASYGMYHQYESAKAAKKTTGMRGFGTVPVSTGTVKQGDIGVYVEGLGTVTPMNTDSITSRVQDRKST